MGKSRPDYELDGLIVEVKSNLKTFRYLRASMLDLAYRMSDSPANESCLLLVDPAISSEALEREWALLEGVLRPEISMRLGIASYRDGKMYKVLGQHLHHKLNQLLEIAIKESLHTKKMIQLPRPDYSGEILRLMILLWLQTADKPSDVIASDPLPYASISLPGKDDARGFPLKLLEDSIGTSYRTVVRALDAIGPALLRHSNRSVSLSAFPRMAWEKSVILADQSRATRYYADQSGQPRSPSSLIRRITRLKRQDVAIGGVNAAMRIFPQLDITGSPRLDLHVHAPDRRADLSFVRKLDPALQESSSPEEKPSLAVHFLRRKESFFRIDEDQCLWADPVECLLDMVTMGMDYQALQFRNAITPKDAEKWPILAMP